MRINAESQVGGNTNKEGTFESDLEGLAHLRALEATPAGRQVYLSLSNSISKMLPDANEQWRFYSNLVVRDVETEQGDAYRGLGTVNTYPGMELQEQALGRLASFRRGEGVGWSLVVKDHPDILRTLKVHITTQLMLGIVPPVSTADPESDPKQVLRDSINHYLGKFIKVSDPSDIYEVLGRMQQANVTEIELYHCREDLLRLVQDSFDRFSVKITSGITPEMARELEKFGGKVYFRDQVKKVWDQPLHRVVAKRDLQPIEGQARTELFTRLHEIAMCSERKDWNSPHGGFDEKFGGTPVYYEQLNNSAGGFNAKAVYRDTDGYLYYVDKESKTQKYFVSDIERASGQEDKGRALRASIDAYIDHLNQFQDEVDIAEFGMIKGMPTFSYECRVEIKNGKVFIETNGDRGNIVVDGDYQGAICGVTPEGLRLELCRELVVKIAQAKVRSIEKFIDPDKSYSFTFGIDFNTVAIPLPDNVEDRESILNEHEKKFGTLSMLDKNHALAIMATEDNNRYTALSHWRMLLAKYDACNGTDLLRQIDQKKLVVVQTDHKVLSENAISKITLGRTLEEGLLKPTAVRNSLQLIKELALAGVSILHGPSPLNSLAKGLRVPNTERPKQGVLLTNAPIDGEVGLLVIGKDMDEVRDQIAKIEAWAGAGKLAEVL